MIREGKFFGIAFLKPDFKLLGSGALARLFEQVRSNIHTSNLAAGPRGWNRRIAGSAGDIENARSGRDLQSLDKLCCFVGGNLGDLAEVAGHPRGFHAGF